MSKDAALDTLRFPVGRFEWRGESSAAERNAWIDEIAALPVAIAAALSGLTPAHLATPYRPGGWTVRQVAHHVPDSHMNAYVRFKFALTESDPVIKPYDEDSWSRLPDTAAVPVETSVALLTALHERWVSVLRGMKPEDWQRAYIHPEMGKVSLDRATGLYAWHGRHHTAHITGLRARLGLA